MTLVRLCQARRRGVAAAETRPRHRRSFTLIFGSLVDTLGSGTSMSESLKPVILWFCYLGAAATVAGYMEIACWELAGMRQANRIRHARCAAPALRLRRAGSPLRRRRARSTGAACCGGACARVRRLRQRSF